MLAQPEMTCQVSQVCYQQMQTQSGLQAVTELVHEGLYSEGALSAGAP